MIVKKYNSLKYPLQIKLKIKAEKPRKVGVEVFDANDKETAYTKRWNTIKGVKELFIMLPQSPKELKLVIYNISKDKNSEGLKLLEFTPMALKQKLEVVGLHNSDVVQFLKLAQQLSERLSHISAGIYLSDNGKFVINLMDSIKEGSKELTTPARINTKTGQIQVSKKIMKHYTVPGIMAILLHEFSHVYLNSNAQDEVEADINAARIYLGLGYPRVELMNTWANVFYKADTPNNRTRWNTVKDYILNFDKV